MASEEKLIELNNQGDLGRMLAERFGGELGYVQPRQDSDLMIGFESRAKTPTAQAIREVVVEHYTRLGYEVHVPGLQSPDAFDAFVFFGAKGERVEVYVNISTFYPLVPGDGHNHLRLTTTLM